MVAVVGGSVANIYFDYFEDGDGVVVGGCG